MNADVNRSNIQAVCKLHLKAREILKKADGKRSYKEIAKLIPLHHTKCSTILNKALDYGLVEKKSNGVYKRKINLDDIDEALKNNQISTPVIETIKVKRKKKVVNNDVIKRQLLDYLLNHYNIIYHPFSAEKKEKLTKEKITKAHRILVQNLEKDLGVVQIEGLSSRFYNSFSDFLSCSPISKPETIASFSNLIKCFEPYLKKVAAIKNNDANFAVGQFDAEMIKRVIPFSSNIKTKGNEYWHDKDIHEACIRHTYPYRHIEAHEARDYPLFEVQRIVYYMFASIIYINTH